MRRVKAWLVSDAGGEWEDAWEIPVIAFTSESAAEECADKRAERHYLRRDGLDDDIWCRVREIEVVLGEQEPKESIHIEGRACRKAPHEKAGEPPS